MDFIMREMIAMGLPPAVREAVMRDPMIQAAAGVYKPPAVVYKPTAVVYKPTAVVYKPTAVVYKPPAVVYKPTAVVYKPPAVVYKPPAHIAEDKMREMDAMGLNPIFREAARRDPNIAAAVGVYKLPAHIAEDKNAYPNPAYIFRYIPDSEGYKLKIIRQMTGTWNGYVTIPSSHPYASKFYDDVNYKHNAPIELTWKRKNDFGVEFGFDHNHSGDTDEEYYANYDKVRQEVIDLFLFFKKAESYVEPPSTGGGGGGGGDTDPI
jgi:hypothetical protein